jgi:hypothetical protein
MTCSREANNYRRTGGKDVATIHPKLLPALIIPPISIRPQVVKTRLKTRQPELGEYSHQPRPHRISLHESGFAVTRFPKAA